jgi:hypothetical protein
MLSRIRNPNERRDASSSRHCERKRSNPDRKQYQQRAGLLRREALLAMTSDHEPHL